MPSTRVPTRPTDHAWVWIIGVLVAAGVAGLAGIFVTLVLHGVQHLAFAQHDGTFAAAVHHATAGRRILAPVLGGALTGCGWWWLRRRGPVPSLSRAARDRPSRRAVRATVADALLQVVAVGSGASIGRETAPRQIASTVTSFTLHRVTPDTRRILVAAAAGGGLAAVYSTPLAGALFAVEITLGGLGVRALLPALIVSGLATVAASPVAGGLPSYPVHGLTPRPLDLLAGATVLAVTLPGAMGFTRLMDVATKERPNGARLVAALLAAGSALGVLSLAAPQLPGNGAVLVEGVMAGRIPWPTLAALVLLKPLLTALFLRAGASGGLLTPAIATGGAAGALVSVGFHGVGLPVQDHVLVILGAVVFVAVHQRAPWFAAVFVWELTAPSFVMLPVLLAGSFVCQVLAQKSSSRAKLPAPHAT